MCPVVPDAAVAEKLEDERRLIEQAKRGDLDAMRPVFETYANPLYGRVILPRLGDASAAEDVLRDTFATAVQRLDGFRWTGAGIYPWLRQIAINKVCDVHRRTQRSRRLLEAFAAETDAAVAPEERPDAQLIAAQEQRESRRRIERALANIPERYRKAIELRLIEERPREECARTLDVKVGTFDVLLYRAVRAFRGQFGGRTS
jgi:RNA polymerase sigma factor (sigma-70 family)